MRRRGHNYSHFQTGGMAEWLKAAVLKTVRGATPSWVRILLPPPMPVDSKRLARFFEKWAD